MFKKIIDTTLILIYLVLITITSSIFLVTTFVLLSIDNPNHPLTQSYDRYHDCLNENWVDYQLSPVSKSVTCFSGEVYFKLDKDMFPSPEQPPKYYKGDKVLQVYL